MICDCRKHERLRPSWQRVMESHGFCYYHYWFNGQQFLERPVNEIWKSGEPDFPFCLCWANENWTRRWDGLHYEVLLDRTDSPADDLAHIRSLIPFFLDRRYIRVMDRPFFAVYRASRAARAAKTTDLWRRKRSGRAEGSIPRSGRKLLRSGRSSATLGLITLGFEPNFSLSSGVQGFSVRKWWHRHMLGTGRARIFCDHVVSDYEELVRRALTKPSPGYPQIPCVCPSWDNSARRKSGGLILANSTPSCYERWLCEIVNRQAARICRMRYSDVSPSVVGFHQRLERMGRGEIIWNRARNGAFAPYLRSDEASAERVFEVMRRPGLALGAETLIPS